MKIVRKGSQESLGDALANEHLGTCVKCVLTDTWVAGSQIMMETRSGKYNFLNFSLNLKKIRVKINCHYTKFII